MVGRRWGASVCVYRLHCALCNQVPARSGSNGRPSASSRSAAARGATELLFLALESAPRGGEGASYHRQHCSPWHIVDEPECKNRSLLKARFWLLLFEFFLQDLAEYRSTDTCVVPKGSKRTGYEYQVAILLSP